MIHTHVTIVAVLVSLVLIGGCSPIRDEPMSIHKIAEECSKAMKFCGDSRVLLPGDADYAYTVWQSNPRVQTYPMMVVQPACTQDTAVVMTVLYRYRAYIGDGKGLVRVASGKHSFEGYSGATGGITIHMGRMRTVTANTTSATARVGGGALVKDAYTVLNTTTGGDWLIVGGFCPTVGLGGFTLGGGYNPWMSRHYGLAADNVQSMTVVLANGTVVQTGSVHQRPTTHESLHWALRGAGGGNFGIVTEMTVSIHQLSKETGASNGHLPWVAFTWPWNHSLDNQTRLIMRVWTEFVQTADVLGDTRFGSNLLVDGGSMDVGIRMLYVGTEEQLNAFIAPLLSKLPPPATRSHGFDSFYDLDLTFGSIFRPFEWAGRMHTSATLLRETNEAVLDVCMKAMARNHPRSEMNVTVDFLYTAGMSKTGGTTGSYNYPEARFNLALGRHWPDQIYDNDYIFWGEQLVEDLKQTGCVLGAYVNYIDGFLTDWVKDFYGDNLQRLQQVKQLYDPTNFWTFKQAVPPQQPTKRV